MTRQLVVFSLAGEEYALPIASVSEIIRHTTLRSVASDAPGVRGVIGLRGKIIILDADGSPVGMCVDQVDEVLTVSGDQLEAVPTAGSAVEAIAKLDDRLVMLLDAAGLHAPAPAAA